MDFALTLLQLCDGILADLVTLIGQQDVVI